MKYFVGYEATGPVARYYERLTKELSRNFAVRNLAHRLPAHITFFPPMTLTEEERRKVAGALERFADENPAGKLAVKGFGCFGQRTVFLKVHAPAATRTLIADLLALGRRLGLRSASPPTSQHISVARFLAPPQFARLWSYLEQQPRPVFDLRLDNLTLFYKPAHHWQAAEQYFLSEM